LRCLQFASRRHPDHAMQLSFTGTPSRDPLQAQVAAHLAATVEATPLDGDPFDHLVLRGVFPDALYPQLLAMLPADRWYRELKHSDAILPDGRSARLQFPLLDSNIARLPPAQRAFWSSIAAAVQSREVEAAYKSKFAAALQRVSGRKLGAIRLRPYATLFRDLGGYRISIHPDSPRKAMTTQFYLPSDDSQAHLGTLFHRRNADGSFTQAKAMRFVPNSGYAFAVAPDSWHSVNPMRDGDLPRDSLMIIINHDRGPLIEGFRTLRAKLRGWWDRQRGEEGEGRYETM